jgi:hypothetical protein
MRFLSTLLLLPLALQAVATVPGTGTGQGPIVDRDLNTVIITESGFITLSADGLGTVNSSGLIQVDKPSAGATVRAAYLAAASTGFSGYAIPDGCIALDGTGVSWFSSTPSGIFSQNHFANVTAIVAPVLNAASAGITSLVIDECDTWNIDGSALYVIFDDPATTVFRTAVIAFGAQSTTGDTFAIGFGQPVDMSLNPVIEMGLAISFGYARGTCQTSFVDVNGSRLTSSAGGNDDGEDNNGALITVGGIGDLLANPADPFHEDPCVFDDFTLYDDERYNIAGFVNDGDTGMSATTFNPSNDDNIFVAHLLLDFAAVVGEGAVLTPSDAVNCLCDQHVVTVTLQDNNGNPLVNTGVTIEVIAGPSTGAGASGFTDGGGQFSFTYSSCVEGQDVIVAYFTNSQGMIQYSNLAYKTWQRCTVDAGETAESFTLAQNTPNPFNPATTISFTLPETGAAQVLVHSLAGELVRSIDLGIAARGTHQVVIDGRELASGVYVYTLQSEFGTISRKMVLMK